jgi:hypothetical protein
VAGPGFSGFSGFGSGLFRAAEQSAKERCVHACHISRPEPKHKFIQRPQINCLDVCRRQA